MTTGRINQVTVPRSFTAVPGPCTIPRQGLHRDSRPGAPGTALERLRFRSQPTGGGGPLGSQHPKGQPPLPSSSRQPEGSRHPLPPPAKRGHGSECPKPFSERSRHTPSEGPAFGTTVRLRTTFPYRPTLGHQCFCRSRGPGGDFLADPGRSRCTGFR